MSDSKGDKDVNDELELMESSFRSDLENWACATPSDGHDVPSLNGTTRLASVEKLEGGELHRNWAQTYFFGGNPTDVANSQIQTQSEVLYLIDSFVGAIKEELAADTILNRYIPF